MEESDRSTNQLHQFSVVDEPPSDVVIMAVAEVKDQSQTDCPPLYDAVDPDALDEIFAGRDQGRVTFDYANCTVTMDASDGIFLENDG